METNLKAFLDMVAYSELGDKLLRNSDDGYNVIVGGKLFNKLKNGEPDYRDHPGLRVYIKPLGIYSTAAGRYQILARYWRVYKKQLGLKDFGHDSQDAIAIQLIKECHSIDDIKAGRIAEAIEKCRSRWASLPGAEYGQHENKAGDLLVAYTKAGGDLA
jgi:muramidase (phage lysozyme)